MERLTKTRFISVMLVLLILLAVAITAGVLTGPNLSAGEAFDALIGRANEAQDSQIVLDVRLPRVLLAAMVGAALAICGVVFQALLRNPLADPFILGVSGGAALGVILSILFLGSVGGIIGALLPISAMPLMAFTGALSTIFLVYFMAKYRGTIPVHTLLLSGVVVNAFFGAIIMFLTTMLQSHELSWAIFYLMGSLKSVQASSLVFFSGCLVLSGTIILMRARDYNILSTGEEQAQQLGVDVERVKRISFVAASLLTGVAVAFVGPIGFVGLIVPHIMRLIFGSDHRLLLPASALAGGIFLILADTGARTLMSFITEANTASEIPVGVITAIAGGPFFLILLRRRQGRDYK